VFLLASVVCDLSHNLRISFCMHLHSGHLVHNLEVIANMDLNSSNALRDIQKQLQLMLIEMNNMTNQMNNLSGKVEFIETLQIRQSSESEHSNDHHRNLQRPIPRSDCQHNQHQGPRNCQYNRNQGHHDYDDPNE